MRFDNFGIPVLNLSDVEHIVENFPSMATPIERAVSSREGVLAVTPMRGSAKSVFLKRVAEERRCVVALYPDDRLVKEIEVELTLLGVSSPVLAISSFARDKLQERVTAMAKRDRFVLVSTYELLERRFPARDKLERDLVKIEVGGEIEYDALMDYFETTGYAKDKFVAERGDYAVRGAVVDFWSWSERRPVRLEFDGDFVESIRAFDPDSQRSIERVESATIAAKAPEEFAEEADVFDYLGEPLVVASASDYALHLEKKRRRRPSEAEPSPANDFQSETDDDSERAEPADEATNPFLENDSPLLSTPNTSWVVERELGGDALRLGFAEAPAINGNYALLYASLKDRIAKGYRAVVAAENSLQTGRLRDLLADPKADLADRLEDGSIRIAVAPLREGFVETEAKFLLLTDYQIFGKPYRSRLPSKSRQRKRRSKEFDSIKPGDFVVHEDYGVGRYAGLEAITIGDVEQESMKLRYDEGSVVYVNLSYLHLVKKFSSREGATPRLSKIGSTEWRTTKKRTKKKLKEIARDLVELYAKRKAAAGHAFGEDSVWQKELEASFMYEDTPDQARAADDVKNDMRATSPMDRLVCGDVGFGKTEVAVRAAFKAAQEGKQVALLAPTTILVEQHLQTFRDRLSRFPVNIEALSRFQTKMEQANILKRLREGTADIVVGTHRLVQKDVEFKDLGLLIIDEEHRFGVTAKERLRSLRANVDTISMTATPIPRTLNFSLLGARDLSIIATPPPNRYPIHTKVEPFDVERVKEYIDRELDRGGQVYIVHDRVQSIDKFAAYIEKHAPRASVAVAHGQMKPSALEKAVHDFLQRKYDVLLSTKIIESGIDIPNVNTIIVNRADRFGMAELHQLRGRVGRSDRRAFAYFLVPSLAALKQPTLRRLRAVEEFTELGAGFNLSMRDLEIRGAGNLLGKKQSGFVDDVGFDLYLKLLDEAVEELKREEFAETFADLPESPARAETTIDVFFEIGIPRAYMPEQTDRLRFYTDILSVKALSELDDLRDELHDRFGKPPALVERLFEAAKMKFWASRARFERIVAKPDKIVITLPKGDDERFYREKFVEYTRFVAERYGHMTRFEQRREDMKIVVKNTFRRPEETFAFLTTFAKESADVIAPPESVREGAA
jgi:transcription-repair coupling factor (superfamily II helicase)